MIAPRLNFREYGGKDNFIVRFENPDLGKEMLRKFKTPDRVKRMEQYMELNTRIKELQEEKIQILRELKEDFKEFSEDQYPELFI